MNAMNSHLDALLSERNAWRELLDMPLLSMDVAEDRQHMADHIDASLSPESLTCDGEISSQAVAVKYKQLTSAAEELKRLDPSVKFFEYTPN